MVFAVRGTQRLMDLLADISFEHPYVTGRTRWGMHAAALGLVNREGRRVAGGWLRPPHSP